MGRRNGFDIMVDIMRVAEGGARKTRLVYRANLNFSIIKKYLSRLIEDGYIRHDAPLYYATEKALDFVEKYDALVAPLNGEKPKRMRF